MGVSGYARVSTADLAAVGLSDVVKNRAVSVPGVANKTLITGSDLLPRSVMRRLSNLAQR